MTSFFTAENILIASFILVWLILLGNIFTFLLQDWFIFSAEKLPLSFRFNFMEPAEEHFIDTPNGGKINLLWFKAGATPSSKGVILYSHGNRGSLRRWGHLHLTFTQLGYDYMVYDYRGYGKSKGVRSEKNMYSDALTMYDFCALHYEAAKIVVFGRSIGSAMAVKIAAEKPCRMLILESPFSSMRDLFYSYYPVLPRIFLFKYRFKNDLLLPHVDENVFIFHGSKDMVVPFRCTSKLLPLLKKGDELITIPEGGHNDLQFFDIYNVRLKELLLKQ